jgi:hypothetical protein
MINKALSVLIIFIFSMTVFSEALEISSETYSHYKEEVQSQTVVLSAESCPDCNDEDCSGDDDCCISYCSCLKPVLIKTFKKNNTQNITFSNLIEVERLQNYKSPELDPALKPPTFS